MGQNGPKWDLCLWEYMGHRLFTIQNSLYHNGTPLQWGSIFMGIYETKWDHIAMGFMFREYMGRSLFTINDFIGS